MQRLVQVSLHGQDRWIRVRTAKLEKALLQSVLNKHQQCVDYFMGYVSNYVASYNGKPCTLEDHADLGNFQSELYWIREFSSQKGFESGFISANAIVLGSMQKQIVRISSYFDSFLVMVDDAGNFLNRLDFAYAR